ncbi:MAG TPA: response regulator transcription factor [Drouetiella sp.]
MAKILLVEDEKDISEAVKDWLAEEHHLVESVDTGTDALEKIQKHNYDLIILDLSLPGMNGMEVCSKYRADGGSAPILMLTAKKSLLAKEAGLDAGSDDYMTKPFQLRELSARVRALLRRPATQPVSQFKAGNLVLDRTACKVTNNGAEVHLLPKEFSLLEYFMRNPNKVASVDDLLDQVWGSETNVVPETVRSTMRSLRQKIDSPGGQSYIRTVHGVGYRLEEQ